MIRKHLFKGLLTTLLVYSPLVHAKSLYGIVVNVADGDTITVLDSSKTENVNSKLDLLMATPWVAFFMEI